MPIELFFIFGLFIIVFGYVIGNFFPVLKDNPFAPKDDDSTAEPSSESNGGDQELSSPTPGLLDITHIWRQEDTKQLVAQIETQFINSGEELTSDQHALLSLVLLDLGDWVGLEARIQAMDELQQSEEEELEIIDSKEPKTPFFSPIDMLKNAVMADVFLPFSDTSLADQINPVLQSLLIDSPLADRGISLIDIEGRGMVVNIGLDMYDSVDDVPDDEIRALIKKAVTVWENSGTTKD